MKKPLFTLQSSDGKREEIYIFPEKIIVSIRTRLPDICTCLFLFTIISIVYLKNFQLHYHSWHTVTRVCYVVFGIFLMCALRGSAIRKYLINFHKQKIFFHLFPFINIPLMSFSDVGGIDRCFVDCDCKERYFYKVWKKGHRFENGIPLTDIRNVLHVKNDEFEDFFEKEFLPSLKLKINPMMRVLKKIHIHHQ